LWPPASSFEPDLLLAWPALFLLLGYVFGLIREEKALVFGSRTCQECGDLTFNAAL
jgi:hypothetical protein